MAVDEGLVHLMREDLDGITGLSEKRMFGGLCFMWQGHMLCGVFRDGLMYRVGKDAEAEAFALPDTTEMEFTGKPMRGFIVTTGEEDDTRSTLTAMALAHAKSLPTKT